MTKNQRNIIGNNLRKWRKRKQITQDELSAKLITTGTNLDRPMISKIENQTREVTDIELVAIAKALKISITHLLDDSGEDNNEN